MNPKNKRNDPNPVPNISSLADATSQHFDKTTGTQLVPFLRVREVKLPPRKLKEQLVMLAHTNKNTKPTLEIPTMPDIETQPMESACLRPVVEFNIRTSGAPLLVLPSSFLEKKEFVNLIKQITKKKISVDDDIKKTADLLLPRLQGRLSQHLLKLPLEKRSHWCLIDFVQPNLPIVAAIIAAQNHLAKDLEILGNNDCLLGSVLNFDSIEDNQSAIGTYLYFDSNRNHFIRSGKATGSTLHNRHAQHIRSATNQSTMTTSKFYRSYPAKQTNLPNTSRLGWFESLHPVVAFGFSPTNLDVITTDISEGGIIMIKEVKEKVEQMNKQTTQPYTAKAATMIAYLFELVYQLCLCPHHDISENPGFESVLGCFMS